MRKNKVLILSPPPCAPRLGAVLVVVLWTMVALSLIVANFAFLVRTQVRISSNYAIDTELREIASAGVELAKASLTTAMIPQDYLGEDWANDESQFRDHPMGGGAFSLIRPPVSSYDTESYGMEDEASKLNLRMADTKRINLLGGDDPLPPELLAALTDWTDDNEIAEAMGAEDEYYLSLEKPYFSKDAPLDTLAEMLLIKGFTPEFLFGEDWNRNGRLDPSENDGAAADPPDNSDGILDRGFLGMVTLYSVDKNVTLNDQPRVNLSSATEEELRKTIPSLTDLEARSIVAWRSGHSFDKVGDLLKVLEPKEDDKSKEKGDQKAPQENKNPRGDSSNNGRGDEKKEDQNDNSDDGKGGNEKSDGANPQNPPSEESKPGARPDKPEQGGDQPKEQIPGEEGKKAFTADRVKDIIDYCAIDSKELKPGLININTAGERVLRTLPGVDKELAESIVRYRESDKQYFRNIAELLEVPNMKEETFINLSELITVRSFQYTVRSIAEIKDMEARKTITAVIDHSSEKILIRYWHEE